MAGIGSMVSVNGNNNAAPVVAFSPGKAPMTTPPKVAITSNNKRLGSASACKPSNKGSTTVTRTKDWLTNLSETES